MPASWRRRVRWKLEIQALLLPAAWCRAIGANASPASAIPATAASTGRRGRDTASSQTPSTASGKAAK